VHLGTLLSSGDPLTALGGTGEQRGSCSVCRVPVATGGAAGVECCKQHEEKVPLTFLAAEVTVCLLCTQLGWRPALPPPPPPPPSPALLLRCGVWMLPFSSQGTCRAPS
uniref:Uncharacterized protein n=1 Tax=Phasianus colchicus TaxID=9054 RepID=A0A669R7L3_PHACC